MSPRAVTGWCASAVLALGACGERTSGPDDRDAAAIDATVSDAAELDGMIDAIAIDAVMVDAAAVDAPGIDAPAVDAPGIDAPAVDAPATDAPAIDATATDATATDAPAIDAGAPPCLGGAGRALWRLSFPAGQGGYARVDAWGAACAYSLADQACSLSGEPHTYAVFGPGIVFDSTTDYFRVRFSVAQLSFTQARIYLAAHAEGGGIPRLAMQTPLHGDYLFQPTVPISTHRTYTIDWSPFLSPADAPSLTAVTLRPMPTGLAVSSIELCVQ